MCTVSDKLILCTCKANDIEGLKNYWILKLPAENDITIIGEILPPANIDEEMEKYNIETLTKQINEGNCFDKELNLIYGENYMLELHFTCFPKMYV